MASPHLRQRADLTHKHNLLSGRHGWLRLTPAYSVRLVKEILKHYDKPVSVLDPFSGTGTSVLAAVERGHSAVGVDINPFLVWLGNVKLDSFAASDAPAVSRIIDKVGACASVEPADPPPIHNIERWWHPEVLAFLCGVRGHMVACAKEPGRVRSLLDVIFCQTVIKLSNAAFNHQSMSFAGERAAQAYDRQTCAACLQDSAQAVLDSLLPNPPGMGKVVLADSTAAIPGDRYDLIVTSPPYPNRISYIRELRPYMYWLGYLTQAKQAGELDWRAVGGTWGTATSRLAKWKPEGKAFLPRCLLDAVQGIQGTDGLSRHLLSAYVMKYFYDMWRHYMAVKDRLRIGAKAVYIVGNSSFYGVPVPAHTILAEMLDRAGFVNVRVEPIRKRNSKKDLFEYAVEGDYAAASPLGQVSSLSSKEPVLFE